MVTSKISPSTSELLKLREENIPSVRHDDDGGVDVTAPPSALSGEGDRDEDWRVMRWVREGFETPVAMTTSPPIVSSTDLMTPLTD